MRTLKTVTVWLPLLAAWVVLLAGCGRSDLGSACQLVQPVCTANCDAADPAERQVDTIPFEAPVGALFDYISTGGTDCDDFTCVDSTGDGDQNPYCSRRCIEDDQCRDGEDDTLVCRALVLDDDFINTLRDGMAQRCESDCDVECPGECSEACVDACAERRMTEVFGDIRTARFCARPKA